MSREIPGPHPDSVELAPQQISRRALLGRAAAVIGAAALGERFIPSQHAEAKAAAPNMNPEDVTLAELLPATEIEPIDPSLMENQFMKISSFDFNTDEVPDAQTRVSAYNARMMSTMYRYRKYYNPEQRGELEARLAEGKVPDDSVSEKFVEAVKDGKEPTIGINAFRMDATDPSQKEYLKVKPTEGVSVRVVRGPGYFNLGLTSFTPRVDDNGKLTYEISIADNQNFADPKIAKALSNAAYQYATEFMAITGGDQELWDTYVQSPTGETTRFMEHRAENAGAIFPNSNTMLMGEVAEGKQGFSGPTSFTATLG